MLVFLAAKSGFIKNAEKAAYLQNFVLCVEMLVAAIGHRFAFSYKEYAGSNARPFGGFRGSLLHAMKFNDFYHDTVHQVNLQSFPSQLILVSDAKHMHDLPVSQFLECSFNFCIS